MERKWYHHEKTVASSIRLCDYPSIESSTDSENESSPSPKEISSSGGESKSSVVEIKTALFSFRGYENIQTYDEDINQVILSYISNLTETIEPTDLLAGGGRMVISIKTPDSKVEYYFNAYDEVSSESEQGTRYYQAPAGTFDEMLVLFHYEEAWNAPIDYDKPVSNDWNK